MKTKLKPAAGWTGIALVLGTGTYFSIDSLREAEPLASPAASGAPPPSTVIVRPVEERETVEMVAVTGTLRAVRRAEIASLEASALAQLHVLEGDEVTKGEVIATLDGRRLDAMTEEAQATLTVAEAQLEQRVAERARAERDLAMMEDLWKERAVAEREVLDSRRGLKVAVAMEDAAADGVSAARKRIELFEVRKADLEVRAPFDGRVVQRHAEIGEWLAEGSPVVTLVSTGEAEAWLRVPERHAVRLEGTDPRSVVLRIPGRDDSLTANNLRVVHDVDGRSRLFTAIVHISDPGRTLVPGVSVEAILPLGRPDKRLAVPTDAILKGYAGSYVYVPDGESPVAKRVDVEVMYERDGHTIFEGDLEPGQHVIVEGNERLMPGAPVEPHLWAETRVAQVPGNAPTAH